MVISHDDNPPLTHSQSEDWHGRRDKCLEHLLKADMLWLLRDAKYQFVSNPRYIRPWMVGGAHGRKDWLSGVPSSNQYRAFDRFAETAI